MTTPQPPDSGRNQIQAQSLDDMRTERITLCFSKVIDAKLGTLVYYLLLPPAAEHLGGLLQCV